MTTPAQAQTLHSQLETLQNECEQALEELVRTRNRGDVAPKLRKRLGEFWAVIGPLPSSMLHASKQEQFDFVQREVVPRRGEFAERLAARGARTTGTE